MKTNIIKVALKNTVIYLILLILLSVSITYITIQIALFVKYAIDGILFSNYTDIPKYINRIFAHNYKSDLLIIAVIIIIFNFIQKLLHYIRDRITTKFKLEININLKRELYKHMLNLEYESYNLYDKDEMIQRIDEDAEVYSKFFNNQFNVILDIIFLTIFIIKEGIELNLQISIYIFLSIITMLLFSIWYYKKLNIYIDNMIIKRKQLLTATIRNINNYKLIRMFNKQKEEEKNYKKLNDNYSNEEVRFIKLVLFYDIILEHLTYVKSPIIYMLGGISIIKGTMTMGSLMALHSFAGKIFDCLYTFGDNLEVIDDFHVVTKKISKLLEQKEETTTNYIYDLTGNIIFSNVNIYLGNDAILKNINLIINQGEKVGIIGENGSGKSILAKTILGFYKYEGNIYINNHNIKRLNKSNIRKYVELILGESYMFSGSIIENIKLKNEKSMDIIEDIISKCEMKDDIYKFKDKYNTLIGEKGTKLSGGQKQRLSIARGIISNKPILILDEALNKLDNKTRKSILSNLIYSHNDKTIILISNNLEIIKYVDSIIYIDGLTTIKGSHKELLEKNTNYRKLIYIKENVI